MASAVLTVVNADAQFTEPMGTRLSSKSDASLAPLSFNLKQFDCKGKLRENS